MESASLVMELTERERLTGRRVRPESTERRERVGEGGPPGAGRVGEAGTLLCSEEESRLPRPNLGMRMVLSRLPSVSSLPTSPMSIEAPIGILGSAQGVLSLAK